MRSRLLVFLACGIVLIACGTPITPTSRSRADQIATSTQVALATDATATTRAMPTATSTFTPTLTPTATQLSTATATSTPTMTPTRPPARTSTATPRKTPTVRGSTPTKTYTTYGKLPFVDDFSDPQTGWPTYETFYSTQNPGTNVIRYLDGEYQVLVDIDETKMTVINDQYWVRDIVIEADITKVSGEDDTLNSYGVECRWQGDRMSGYIFHIFSYGGWGVHRFENGTAYRLGSSLGRVEPAVLSGNSTNHLRAECIGDQLRLSINGTLIFETVDPKPFMEPGRLTLVANRKGPLDLDIRYDNFVASAP